MRYIINDRARRERLARFMKRVTAVDEFPHERNQQPPPRISQEALQLLIQASTHPDQTFLELFVVTTLELVDETTTFVINASNLGAWLRAFGGGTYPPPSFANQADPADCP